MSRARKRLTAALTQQIVAAIRSGSFLHVAAQAFGVAPALLDDWLRRGRDKGRRGPYRRFAAAVAEAVAQARLRAEMAVFADDPRCWLQHGPGRERPEHAGWTAPVRPETPVAGATSVLADPVFQGVMATLTGDVAIPAALRDRLLRQCSAADFRQAA